MKNKQKKFNGKTMWKEKQRKRQQNVAIKMIKSLQQ